MPIGSFKTKAAEYVRKFQREMKATHIVDVMEAVIDALATFFVVSRHAAKMRMVDAGYKEAIGAFTYIDGRYRLFNSSRICVIISNKTLHRRKK